MLSEEAFGFPLIYVMFLENRILNVDTVQLIPFFHPPSIMKRSNKSPLTMGKNLWRQLTVASMVAVVFTVVTLLMGLVTDPVLQVGQMGQYSVSVTVNQFCNTGR